VATAGLAEVLVGHDRPTMLLGGGDHPLDQAPVRLLEVRAAGELGLRIAKAHGEGVAHTLELGRREHPRAADRADAPPEPGPGERRGEELAEAAVEEGDLASQVVACGTFGARGDRCAEHLGAGRHPRGLGLVERSGHGAPLPVACPRDSSRQPARLPPSGGGRHASRAWRVAGFRASPAGRAHRTAVAESGD
jgi:hypothetical protein